MKNTKNRHLRCVATKGTIPQKKYFFCGGRGGHSFLEDISLGRVEVPSPNKDINLLGIIKSFTVKEINIGPTDFKLHTDIELLLFKNNTDPSFFKCSAKK